jgi:hypothetical protein
MSLQAANPGRRLRGSDSATRHQAKTQLPPSALSPWGNLPQRSRACTLTLCKSPGGATSSWNACSSLIRLWSTVWPRPREEGRVAAEECTAMAPSAALDLTTRPQAGKTSKTRPERELAISKQRHVWTRASLKPLPARRLLLPCPLSPLLPLPPSGPSNWPGAHAFLEPSLPGRGAGGLPGSDRSQDPLGNKVARRTSRGLFNIRRGRRIAYSA